MTGPNRFIGAPLRGVAGTRGRFVEVFADVRCPFAHVALLRFMERRRELGVDDVSLVVRAWPLELVNGAPLDSKMISQKVRALRGEVAPALFRGFDDVDFPATSMPALRLEVSARRQSADIGERVSLALRDALFERGRNIADPSVLRDIAATCGVQERLAEVDEVIADWRDGERRGVIGSPHFFGASGNWFCPTLTITHLDGELRMVDNGEGLDRFAAACLSG